MSALGNSMNHPGLGKPRPPESRVRRSHAVTLDLSTTGLTDQGLYDALGTAARLNPLRTMLPHDFFLRRNCHQASSRQKLFSCL